MPIYTYRCDECGLQYEQHQGYNDPVLTRCPECNKNALRKVFLPVGIVFKGSGFYATDHKSPSGQKHTAASKEKDGEAKESPSTTEAKAENKAEAKPEVASKPADSAS